jgi:hypothetical protein
MQMLRLPALSLVLCAVAAFGANDTGDGNKLLSKCTSAVKLQDSEALSPSEMRDAEWCLGYVSGIDDGIEMAFGTSNTARLYCIPEGVTSGQGVRVVVKWLRNHPDKLHNSARVLVVASLADAFPCK